MRRVALVAAALVVPVLPMVAAAPAFAADNVICVNISDASCVGAHPATIQAAITVANSNGLPDTILVGTGNYNDGPYQLNGNIEPVTLKGSGPGTVLTLASGGIQTYVTADHATIRDLTVQMVSTTSGNDIGASVFGGSVVDHVTVDGAGTSNARGLNATNSLVSSSSILMPVADANSRGVYAQGGTTVTDTTVTGAQGFLHSGPATTDTLSRVTLTASSAAVTVDSGTVNVDDAVIDLGTSGGGGLVAANSNASPDAMTINATHVTVVGGGANSVGVAAYASAVGAKQTTTISLDSSIVRGPATSLAATAGNDGAQGGSSTATMNVSYTDYQTATNTIGANGAGGVAVGPGTLNVDPAFVNQAGGNYRLQPGSPVIDKGNPAVGPPTLDRDSQDRAEDGDNNGTPVRDMGAYEVQDVTAPDTAIIGGPSGATADTTPTFTFSSEPVATFECRIDGAAYAACSGPGALHTPLPLADGQHTLFVRAKDAAGNTDASPPSRTFTVDTTAPETTFTTKPKKHVTKGKVTFGFTASELGVSFKCQLDGGPFHPCTSPWKFKVTRGKHTVAVQAHDAVGNTDSTPAVYKFKRLKPNRK